MADAQTRAECGALCGQVLALENSYVVPLLLPVPGHRRPKTLRTKEEIEDAIDEFNVQFAACLCPHTGGDACAKGECKCVNYSMKFKRWSRWYDDIIQVKKEFRNCVNKARKHKQLADKPMVPSSSTAPPTNTHPEQVPCPCSLSFPSRASPFVLCGFTVR